MNSDLKEVTGEAMWLSGGGRAFQAAGKASAKALKQENPTSKLEADGRR